MAACAPMNSSSPSSSSGTTTATATATRYVVVTGGVLSGLGKGTTISSIGALLRARGVLVTAVKIDPYLNVDAGTMSPEEHGECFVLEDGNEVDLDLGGYERFLRVRLSAAHSITSGKVFRELLVRERRGDYLGRTVQIVPHATNLVEEMIETAARTDVWNARWRNSGVDDDDVRKFGPPDNWVDITNTNTVCDTDDDDEEEDEDDGNAASPPPASATQRTPQPRTQTQQRRTTRARVCLVELGGTVGDIESAMFLTALRDLRARLGPGRVRVLHVSLVPEVGGDQKTKPTQHSVMALRRAGLTPDMLVCRCASPLRPSTVAKLRSMCQVRDVVCMPDVPDLYHVPGRLRAQGVDASLGASLGLWSSPSPSPSPSPPPPVRDAWWDRMATYLARCRAATGVGDGDEAPLVATIGVVGKYVARQSDAYLSLRRALMHAGESAGHPVRVVWIDTRDLVEDGPGDTECADRGGGESKVDHGDGDRARIVAARLEGLDAIVVPGGFGARGFEEKVAVVRHARRHGVPFLGLCLGFQAAVVEYARAEAGLAGATSEEFAVAGCAGGGGARAPHVVASMPETDKTRLGGTMRLGIHWARVRSGSLAHELYREHGDGTNVNECHRYYGRRVVRRGRGGGGDGGDGGDDDDEVMYERHRHRYEVSPVHVTRLEAAGLVFSATDCDRHGGQPHRPHRSVVTAEAAAAANNDGSGGGGGGDGDGETTPPPITRGRRMEILELPRSVHPFFVACQFHPEYRSYVGAPHPLFAGVVAAAAAAAAVTRRSARRPARRRTHP